MPRATNETLLVLKLAKERAQTSKHALRVKADSGLSPDYKSGFDGGVRFYEEILIEIMVELGYR